MNKLTTIELEDKARHLRIDILKMLNKSGSGHSGGSLSAIDIMTVLYNNVLTQDSSNPKWEGRDRFFLSKGHVNPALYVSLADQGYFDKKELDTLRKFGSILQGHPCMNKTPGVEVSGGSLGQGLSIAIGVALALKMDKKDNRVYCMLGDGENQEGQVWEAAMSAPNLKLDNLCAILDVNRIQIDGFVEDIMDINPIKDKWLAFKWNVIEINGHDVDEIEKAFEAASTHKGQPTIILAHTVKGKGVSYMENIPAWHGAAPNDEQLAVALKELEG